MSGARPDLVLVHGWASTPAVWTRLGSALAQRFRVFTPALPGYGEEPAECWQSAERLADWLRSRTPAGATWIAWSTAALAAFPLAAGATPHIGSLNTISGVVRFTRAPDWPYGVAPGVVADFRAALEADPAALLNRFSRLMQHPDGRRPAVGTPARGGDFGKPPSAEVLAKGLDLLAGADIRGVLGSVRIPVTLFHGAADKVVAAGSSTAAADMLADGRAVLLPGAGHAPFLADPHGFLHRFDNEGRY